MTQNKDVEALKLFNEKAKKLERLSFTKKILTQPSGVKIDFKKETGVKVKRRGPEENSIDAFVLTLRFFVQDNEICSFRNMAKIYEGLPISTDKKKSFNKIRNFVNTFLNKDSPFVFGKRKLKNRQIFETFMYGGLAHANKEKKKEHEKWVSDPYLEPLLTNEFVWIMAEILKAIFHAEKVNEQVIKELRSIGYIQR